MILTIDVGNTSTSFGLFRDNKLTKRWAVSTDKLLSNKGLRGWGLGTEHFAQVIVASVVPKVDKFIKKAFSKAIFVSHKNIGIKIKLKNPAEVGADRLVDALAACILYGSPAIVIDFGTATTFDVISKNGEYLGGAIVPGIQMSADALHERTAKLPKIKIKAPKNLIGDSTISAMQSGILYGYVSLVEGMIKRLKVESRKSKVESRIIATGGYARFISKYASGIDIIDTDLTLKGLNLLCQKN